MLDRIINFSIRNKLVIGFFILGLVVWGIYSLSKLPIDAVPDITNNQVQIITQAPNLGAQEVEQFITAPVELAMSNIPKMIEKRSISRSGISVVTLVFHDNTDIYWARAQVNERLKEAQEVIPEGMGKLSLAPITTGLGEIYQYTIHTSPQYKDKYSPTDLRTIQDWIVKTQLAGTEGVAEVSGWGGYVKQYEVAVDNDRLNSLNITIPEVFKALENNNANTGGSYIEQRSNAYFIRGIGQVKSLADIEKIVIKNVNGTPILIRDVARVQFGSATRYGAVTRNGEGEVVAGITLMLKGEDFNKVIANVKERMKQIQKSLPEGVVIEPFIDRTELVGRTIGTVKKNLLEGGLIVVFVLVLLLGNWRAGLLVASVIPLAMLFAFALMKTFGVSGNLMSLGAIDFGLIVDGAVIIVEAIIFRISESHLFPDTPRLAQKQMDKEVHYSASRMMNSAAFGQIIILIVYIPLFSLVGVEGKMFKPMAQTVAFAILGAFILSLTYVPMMSALFLSKSTVHKKSFSDRIMNALHRVYQPALRAVLKWKVVTVIIAFAMFIVSLIVFNNMGGQFIPTLEEGDLTVEVSMMQGTSLTQTIDMFSRAEKILKNQFPEVKQVVTRIGSAEIPTDPMPVERADMMVAMKPKEEWTSAKTREEMMEKMEEALSVLPGLQVEITQPMQMRFNELLSGIRQDVAIKIFGDDLDILTQQANKIAKLISNVKGVETPYVEKVTGLPQIAVEYNRDKMAQYGLSINDVNMILQTAFAGKVAGVVFEGEKRFDLVVRLQKNLRQDEANVENLFIPLPSGSKVPLSEVANIEYKEAPAQISREGGKRRTFVGFNVRGRDVESTVEEIQKKLDKELKLPTGYYITYGGEFQNLQEAKARLSVAVPVALLLILVLLYITFRSIPQTLLIFTAVPLSAIGGVFALQIRGMPFSISAGVGFIALFGVAVLNGIVLIGYFNQLKKEGVEDVNKRVIEGTKVRLRPVIMTAAVASLGFLPMALSTGAGGEVQKPLATVVIGGLITATFLTLFVLPSLYVLISKKFETKKLTVKSNKILLLAMGISLSLLGKVNAQTTNTSLNNLIQQAKANNLQLKRSGLEIQQNNVLQRASVDLPKTNFTVTQDPTSGGNLDNSIGISQLFSLPTVYKTQRKVYQQQTKLAELNKNVTQAEIVRNIKLSYYNYLYTVEKLELLDYLDSVYTDFFTKAETRYKVGETSNLEKLTAQNQSFEIRLQKKEALADLKIYETLIRQQTNITGDIIIDTTNKTFYPSEYISFDTAVNQNSILAYHQQNINLASSRVALEKTKSLPEFSVGYYHQFIIKGFDPAKNNRNYFPGTRIAGVELGMSLPLFTKPYKARVEAERLNVAIAQQDLNIAQWKLTSQYQSTYEQYLKHKERVDYYQSDGIKLANEQIRIARFAFNKGEISYVEMVQNLTQATQIKLQYLEALQQMNEAIINLKYLKGQE